MPLFDDVERGFVMRVKIICAALCALVLLAAPLWGRPAFAARTDPDKAAAAQAKDPRDTLSVTASVSPAGMAVPTEAQIYITLVNGATEPISDVCIMNSDGALVKEVGELSGSGRSSDVYEEKLVPTNKQLKAEGIEYQVLYTLDKGKPTELRRKVIVLAQIARLQAEPGLEFTRTPSSNYAQPGEEVTITYRLRNTGNVPLTDMALKDPLCGEIGTVESLGPGKRTTLTASVIIQEDAESKPSVSYTYPGIEDRLTKKLDPITIHKADERLEARLDADKSTISPGEIVRLQLKVSNRGNVTYDKLEIKDDVLGALGSMPVELKPGDDYWFVKRINMKSTSTFLFTVSGKSSSGAPVTAVSNMLTVAVTPAVDDIKLTLTAEMDNASPPAPGPVDFNIVIHNGGEMDIRNVVLSERARGEIKTLAVVPPGDTVVPQVYDVEADESFQFMAALSDAQGGQLTKLSPKVDIHIQPATAMIGAAPLPKSTAILAVATTSYQMDDSEGIFRRMVVTVMALLAVLMAVLVTSTLVRYSRRRKQKRQLIKRLRKGRRAGRDLENSIISAAQDRIDEDTGVYRKADLIPNKESL